MAPTEVDRQSVWQMTAAWNGYVQAHSPKDGAKLSDSEADELFDWIEAGTVPADGVRLPKFEWDGRFLSLVSHQQ
jgi:hypothetical protein